MSVQRAALAFGVALALAIAAYFYFLAPTSVTVVKPERGPAVEAVYATGIVEPEVSARLAPKVSGRIVEVAAEEGDKISVGDILLRLDDEEAAAQVAQLGARAAYWEAEAGRVRRLKEKGHASAEALDRAISEWEAAAAAHAVAEAKLKEYTIRSPIDGVVLREDADVGDLAAAGQPLFTVGCNICLQVEAEVDEEDIPLVEPGQLVLVKADAFPDTRLEGRVSYITPQGDPIARRYRVYVALAPDTPLYVGMTTELNILIEERSDALLVPRDALTDGALWIVEDNIARKVKVTPGVIGADKVEIRDGLSDDQWVVASPPAGLEDGERVSVRR